jgi:uncharacterized delta-60 repeat protein
MWFGQLARGNSASQNTKIRLVNCTRYAAKAPQRKRWWILILLHFQVTSGWSQTSLGFEAGAVFATEGQGAVSWPVLRLGETNTSCSVRYRTRSDSAEAGLDFQEASGTLIFAPGETRKEVIIGLEDDGLVEETEMFGIQLFEWLGATPGVSTNVNVIISDNEKPTFIDGLFTVDSGANNDVFAIALQSDGKILLGGQFTSYQFAGFNRVTRLQVNGVYDPTFTPGIAANAEVYAVAVQPDGKILLGGNFTSFNGNAASYVVRLQTNGIIDSAFGIGLNVNGPLRAIVLQSDGKIVIGGRFTAVTSRARGYVARLNADGTLDTNFFSSPGANGFVRTVALQADGNVVIGGEFTLVDGRPRARIARLTSSGVVDVSFNPGLGADSDVRSIAIQSDSRVLAGGDFTTFDGKPYRRIVRLATDGSVDETFQVGSGLAASVRGLCLQPDGKILLGGAFAGIDSHTRRGVLRLLSDGSFDDSFGITGGGFAEDVFALAWESDGRIIVGGQFTTLTVGSESYWQPHVSRLYADRNQPAVFFPQPVLLTSETNLYVEAVAYRTGASTEPVTVPFTTVNDRAEAGMDYIGRSGVLAFDPLTVSAAIRVSLLDDFQVEEQEYFTIELGLPSTNAVLNANVTRVSIGDDDRGIITATTNVNVLESIGFAEVLVRRLDHADLTESVDFFTQPGTALEGFDFIQTNGTLLFSPNQTTAAIRLRILSDDLTEPNEQFRLVITNSSLQRRLGALRTTTVTIVDAPRTNGVEFFFPLLAIREDADGPSVSPVASFPVFLQGSVNSSHTVDWRITPGTARWGEDFAGPISGQVTFPPGSNFEWITIPILNDGIVESNETLTIMLEDPLGGLVGPNSTATLIIEDNDAGVEFTSAVFEAEEGLSSASISIARRDDGPNPISVDYVVSPGSATPGLDYLTQAGTVIIPTGLSTQVVNIPLLDDCIVEETEDCIVTLLNPTSGASLGPLTSTRIRIRDNGRERPGSRDFAWQKVPLHGVFAVQPDGKVVIAGLPALGSSSSSASIVRVRPDGRLDATFDASSFVASLPGSQVHFSALTIEPGGSVLLAGSSSRNGAGEPPFVVRLRANGTLDARFEVQASVTEAASPHASVEALAVLPSGKILVGGAFDRLNGITRRGLVRLFPDGSLDSGFASITPTNQSGLATIAALAVQADGSVVLGGTFGWIGNSMRRGLARLTPDGQLDASFNPRDGAVYQDAAGVHPDVSSLVLEPQGAILAGGKFRQVDGVFRSGVARLRSDGSLDLAFDPGAGANIQAGHASVQRLVRQWDGKIILTGTFTNFAGVARVNLARLHRNGSVDLDFEPDDQWAYVGLDPCVLTSNGQILVGNEVSGLVRLHGEPPIQLASKLSLEHGVQLSFDTCPGNHYSIEASSDLRVWVPVLTNRASGCTMDISDIAISTNGAASRLFFRATKLER